MGDERDVGHSGWHYIASEELVLCYSSAEGVLKIDSLQRVILQPGHSEVGGGDGDGTDCCSCRIVSYSNDADTKFVKIERTCDSKSVSKSCGYLW